MATRMSIPLPYIFTIDTPLVLIKNRIFQPSQKTLDDDNYLELNPEKYSLEEIATAKSLEDLYFLHNSELFERYQSRYIQDNIKKDLMSSTNLNEEVKKNKILSFIIKDVLPLITAEKLDNEISEILVEDRAEQDSLRQRRHATSRYFRNNSRNTNIRNRTSDRTGNDSDYDRNVPINGTISRAVLSEARKMKRDFLKKLDDEYSIYITKKRNNHSTSIDDSISEILQSRDRSRKSNLPHYPLLNDGSIFVNDISSQDIMFIGESVYDLVKIKEFISYFKNYMTPDLYRSLMSFESVKNPQEINVYIRQHIFEVDKSCRSRIRNKLKSSMLKIDGQYFIPFLKENSAQFRSALIENYSKMIEKKIKADSFEKYESQTQEFYDIAEERRKLNDLFDSNNYDRKGAGFKKINGEYYVYVITPPYALKSPHISNPKKYIEFPPAIIGVKIRHNGSAFDFGNPETMKQYTHPFLGSASAHKSICLGDKGSSVVNGFRRLSPEQTVLSLLDQGRKTLMMGYKTGSNPYIPLHSDKWNCITKEEVERKGLVCLNEGW